MNIKPTYIIILFTCFFAYGQTNSNAKKYNGFEIFFVKNYKGSERSYWDFDEKKRKLFKKEYKKITQIPDSICNWYINVEKSQIAENPFLNESDIEYYSPSDFIIKLTDSGKEKIKNLRPNKIPVSGKPYIIVANGKKLLGAWFWTPYSSSACDRVFSLIEEGTDQIKLSFLFCGTDPRNKPEILKALTELK